LMLYFLFNLNTMNSFYYVNIELHRRIMFVRGLTTWWDQSGSWGKP
jgi:hypothetical protein